MAARESDLHAEVKKAIKLQLGGRAFKASDRHLVGVLDIYSVCRRYGSIWIELKFLAAPKQQKTPLHLALTTNQRLFGKTEQRAGGCAGWILCTKYEERRVWRYHAGANFDVETLEQHTFDYERKAGAHFEIDKLLGVIHSENAQFSAVDEVLLKGKIASGLGL